MDHEERYEEPDGIVEELNHEADEQGRVDEDGPVPPDTELLDESDPLAGPRFERGRSAQAGL
jgi:hypothetical protein